MIWDVFISHASEDKESFVRPLAKYLKENHIKVWYDEFTLDLGVSLREKIDEGIRDSKFGVIILSPNFLKKDWTKKELNAFFSKEIFEKQNKILPIWLDISSKEIYNFSPMLFDRKAIKGEGENVKKIGDEIISKIINESYSAEELKEKISEFYTLSKFDIENKIIEINFRLLKIYNYFQEIGSIDIPDFLLESKDDEFEKYYQPKIETIEKKYRFPPNVWIHEMESFNNEEINYIKSKLPKWLKGKMNLEECNEFFFQLDFLINIDYTYLIFEVPNYSFFNSIFNLKDEFYKIGSRNFKN